MKAAAAIMLTTAAILAAGCKKPENPTPASYTTTVSASPTDGGTVTGGGSYQEGQSCTVLATANSGYTFAKWTENGNEVSTSNKYTFTVTGDRDLVANFTVNMTTYAVSVSAKPKAGGALCLVAAFTKRVKAVP